MIISMYGGKNVRPADMYENALYTNNERQLFIRCEAGVFNLFNGEEVHLWKDLELYEVEVFPIIKEKLGITKDVPTNKIPTGHAFVEEGTDSVYIALEMNDHIQLFYSFSHGQVFEYYNTEGDTFEYLSGSSFLEDKVNLVKVALEIQY